MMVRRSLMSFFIVCAASLALTGCGSSVKLDEVPVTDAKSTPMSPVETVRTTPPASTQTGVTDRNVQPIQVDAAALDKAGPQGAAKVILFDYDSFVIKPEYQSLLEAHARFLSAIKTRKIAIEGHTDERGGREYNLALGQKRAEAVRRALGLLGVADNQMEAVSLGEEKPADAASNEAAYAKNRRTELNYR
jgi:peptidoglycan-associated lipoprotein